MKTRIGSGPGSFPVPRWVLAKVGLSCEMGEATPAELDP
jgi:hypothetical protein